MGGTAGMGGTGGVVQTQASLSVTIGGLPVGTTASVTITGPSNYVQTISASTTLSGLASGSYAISAPAVRVAGTLVDSVLDATVSGNPATVVAGTTSTATVSYAQRPGTGTLWATNTFTRNAFGFDATALGKAGAQTDAPSVSLTLNVAANSLGTPAIAFSAVGEMWVGSCRNAQVPQVLAKYTPPKLAATGTPSADITITLPAIDNSYDCADALAFDVAGNLWVGLNHGHILRYNAADLLATGAPAPAVNLTSATYFNGVLDIAFDGSGNLFVASYSTRVISRLSASQLATSNAAIVPDVQLTLAGNTAGPGGLALAKDGSLWISDYNNSSIIKLSAASLGTTSTPAPALTITGVPGAEQLAFDNAGNLWVAAYDTSTIIALSAEAITTGGTKSPLTTLNGNGVLTTAFGVRFNPAAN